jgi:hypothetical protein
VGVRILFFSQNFYYFFLGAHAKFQTPTITPSGRISNELERKRRREKKMPFIVATYVYASSQGQRTHSARTNNASMFTWQKFCNAYEQRTHSAWINFFLSKSKILTTTLKCATCDGFKVQRNKNLRKIHSVVAEIFYFEYFEVCKIQNSNISCLVVAGDMC